MLLLVATLAPLTAAAVRRDDAQRTRQAPRIDAATRAMNVALVEAAGEGDLGDVTELLNRGADRLLVSRGANVNARAWADTSHVIEGRQRLVGEWRTPLNMAIRGRHDAIVQYLRSMGAVE